MARKQPTCTSIISTIVFSMALTGMLQLILVVSALAERCTRAVPVQKHPPKKMHVLRRLPAACSNWDKAWSWITKADCGTKYRLDYVTVPSSEVQYKLQFVCCDGDTNCEEAENIHSSGFDSTDEKFLAIVLGSTAAVVIIIIVIIAISLCTRKRRCLSARENGHSYDRAEAEDKDNGNLSEEKCCHEDRTSDEECKLSEPVYAEIGDSTLPRYTDLFKQGGASAGEDPFKHATAPPIHAKKNSTSANLQTRAPPTSVSTYSNTSGEGPARGRTISTSSTGAGAARDEDKYACVNKSGKTLHQVNANGEITETRYYNVREKKKKKKKNRGVSKERSGVTVTAANNGKSIEDGAAAANSVRKARPNAPVAVEMMVKSSSTCEAMAASRFPSRETSLSQQKRRSAPPDSPELRVISGNSRHGYAPNCGSRPVGYGVPSKSKMADYRTATSCDVISACTVHQKPRSSSTSSAHSKTTNERKKTNSVKNQRMGANKGPCGGDGCGGKRDAVIKSSTKCGNSIKSPPSLATADSQCRSQSYENIPETHVKNSNSSHKVKPSKKRVREGEGHGPPASHAGVHFMPLHKNRDLPLNTTSISEVSEICVPKHLPEKDDSGSHLPDEETEAISPLLSHPEKRTNQVAVSVLQGEKDLDLSCASPLLNEQHNYLSSLPSSQSGASSEGAWSPTSGQVAGDYDTLQYSYDPSIDEEHLYQKLGRLDPASVPKC